MNNSENNVPVVTGSSIAVAPQNGGNAPFALAGTTHSSAAAVAEVLGQIQMAIARPRDEVSAMKRVLANCQRPSLAQIATYTYKRGGTEITGASVHLLKTIACSWKNINFGYVPNPEKANTAMETHWIAYAFDLENNIKAVVPFDVKNFRYVGGKNEPLTSDRDIYENIASMASRRVRKCLEDIIPADIVAVALEECEKTLRTTVGKIDEDMVDKLKKAFSSYGVTEKMIEEYIQRPVTVECLTPPLIVKLRKVIQSIKEGEPIDTFFVVENVEVKKGEDGKEKTIVTKKKHGKTVEEFLADHPPVIETPTEDGSGELDIGDVK